jgi:hypothetical protein
MTIKKEDCEKVILTTGEMSLLKSTRDATAYRVENEYYDFEFTDEENPFGAKFVISERAWTIKKPRTKTEFVKCEFECAWHAIKAFEDGEELYTKRSHKDFVLIDNAPDVLRFLYDLHRKVETEIDERQEFIDTAVELLNRDDHGGEASYYEGWFESMFDSGKFKLVE